MRKGISPLVAMVVLIIIVFGIAGVIGPWLLDLVRSTTSQTGSDIDMQLLCSDFAYDFDTSYGIYGIDYNLASNKVDVKIDNKGSVNAYNFSFELMIETPSGLSIENFEPKEQIREDNPLKPGESAIISANITNTLTGTLKDVKILNSVCPDKFIEQVL